MSISTLAENPDSRTVLFHQVPETCALLQRLAVRFARERDVCALEQRRYAALAGQAGTEAGFEHWSRQERSACEAVLAWERLLRGVRRDLLEAAAEREAVRR